MAGTLHRALLNRYALGTALTLVIAPFASSENAEACTPATSQASPVNNNPNVTCSGATTDQNPGFAGWGTGVEAGNTITIQAGATVTGTGTNDGISVADHNTIANSGAVSGANFGIVTSDGSTLHNTGNISGGIVGFSGVNQGSSNIITVDNAGNISGTNAGSTGLSVVGGALNLTSNTGTITGVSFGIAADSATIVNNGGGVISATAVNGIAIGGTLGVFNTVTLTNAGSVQSLGANGIGVAGQTVNVTNSNTGGISGGVFGIDATGTTTVTNNFGGTIQATGANGVAIGSSDTTPVNTITLANAGTVQALGAFGIGIQSQTANVTNSSTGRISGDEFGIIATGTATISNQGHITGTGAGSIAIDAGIVNVISNTGMITATNTAIQSTSGSATVNNAGTISGSDGITARTTATVTNAASGMITGLSAFGIDADTVIVNNAGSITGGNKAIVANAATITNSGVVTGANRGIDSAQITLANAGTVQATAAGGVALAGQTINVTSNTGLITGDAFGISAFGAGSTTVTNNSGGTISATGANGVAIGSSDPTPVNTVTLANAGLVQANGTGGIAVVGQTVNVTSNTGMVSGIRFGIDATKTANITNNAGGTIQATGAAGIAIGSSDPSPADTVTLANAGTIKGGNGAAILAQTVNITSNSGTISADGAAIEATGAITIVSSGQITSKSIAIQDSTNVAVNVTNSGLISGLGGMSFAGSGSVTNSGTISGTSFAAISFGGPTSIANFAGGTISSKVGIFGNGAATITNFGTIQSTAGATGTAIQLSNASDTLNIKNGSSIIGLIDMGHGADVINVDSTIPSSKGVSMLSRATSAVVGALEQQLRNFDGVINIIGGGNAGGQPTVTVNGRTASLDPTALAQQDRTLMDFTGGMSSMVQGRLGGAATGSGPQAMSYAMEDARAEMFSKAPAASWNAPVNVWSSAFGASRSQNGTDTTLDSTSSVYGGVIGVDRRIRPDWLVGAFAGGGSGTLNVDLSSQKVSTDYFSAGAYSRFEWDAQFIDMTLQAGGINNRSTRLVQNNIAGGNENATASYNGWFVSPEVAYGYHIDLGNGTMVTPTARVRYVAGLFGGYTETGSAQTLTIGSRTLQDFEERGEVEVSRTGLFGDAALKGTLHGGVIALQRVGDSTVNAVLIGQNLSFITPGRSSAVGAVGGVGLDYHVTPNVALFGAVEGMMMSDESRIGSAKGGVRVAF